MQTNKHEKKIKSNKNTGSVQGYGRGRKGSKNQKTIQNHRSRRQGDTDRHTDTHTRFQHLYVARVSTRRQKKDLFVFCRIGGDIGGDLSYRRRTMDINVGSQ